MKCYNYDQVMHSFQKRKIHKENASSRIIISSINTTLYPFAKFLNKIISDNIPHSENQVKNSFELCSTLSMLIISESYILASFDVVSLFTNVRHSLTHAAICGRICSCPAAYSSPIGERFDASASRWREHRACSVWLQFLELADVPCRYPVVTRSYARAG